MEYSAITQECIRNGHVRSGGDKPKCYTCKAISEGYTMQKELPARMESNADFGFNSIEALAPSGRVLFVAVRGRVYRLVEAGSGYRAIFMAGPEDFAEADRLYAEGRKA